ncbi:hypothetical protein Q8A67_019303 [Cirrhinus molitorella]|uniref:Uncharacterized protein n=1 Tax=Cirrhinus molitorella TaxID=172907 RepID=A0AA88PFA0_9TELE|nr:hypothetical protein Q8A67_019303 [Cirrhinus molitorella]
MMTRRAECRGDPIQRVRVCVYHREYVGRTLLKLLLVGSQQPFSDLLQGPTGRKSHPPIVPLSRASARVLRKYKHMTTNTERYFLAKAGGGFVLQEQTESVGKLTELVRDVRQNGAKDSVAIKCLANRLTMPSCRAKPTTEKSGEGGL